MSLPEEGAAGRIKQDKKPKGPWKTGANFVQRLTRTFLGTPASEKKQVRYILTRLSIYLEILVSLRAKLSCLMLLSAKS
jgi:hypothetical protein